MHQKENFQGNYFKLNENNKSQKTNNPSIIEINSSVTKRKQANEEQKRQQKEDEEQKLQEQQKQECQPINNNQQIILFENNSAQTSIKEDQQVVASSNASYYYKCLGTLCIIVSMGLGMFLNIDYIINFDNEDIILEDILLFIVMLLGLGLCCKGCYASDDSNNPNGSNFFITNNEENSSKLVSDMNYDVQRNIILLQLDTYLKKQEQLKQLENQQIQTGIQSYDIIPQINENAIIIEQLRMQMGQLQNERQGQQQEQQQECPADTLQQNINSTMLYSYQN